MLLPCRAPFLLLPLGLLASCTPPEDDGRTSYDDTGEPVEDPGGIVVDAELSPDVPTVVAVTWSGEAAGTVRIEYGRDATYGRTATAADGESRVVLVGFPPESDVHFRAVVEGEGEPDVGEDHVIRTGARPANVPVMEFGVDAGIDGWGEFILLPVGDAVTKEMALVLVDRDGETVWWKLTGMFPPAVKLSERDGSILFRIDGQFDDEPNGAVHRMNWFDGASDAFLPTDDGHHDFLELSDGSIAVIEQDIRDWNGDTVVGDRIVEYGRDGVGRQIWSAWDTLTPVVDADWGVDANPLGVDWTHANGLDYDAATGRYLVSLFYEESVLAISRASGEIEWQLGGVDSDYSFGADPGFGPQHAPSFVDGGVLLFDNHSPDAGDDGAVQGSRAVRYALDGGVATPVWQWTVEEGRVAGILGDARLLEDGSVYLSNGIGGVVEVVTADGTLAWSASFEPGSMVGRGMVLGGDLRPR